MALAPMADVTDAPFRRIIAKYGKPDVMFTEFVSADGLMLANERGKARLKKDLIFIKEERPIVAQFFSSKPDMIEGAARLARKLGFDGVDINMGCPDKSVERQGAGASLMKNHKLASELIAAAKRGAGPLPVSVKTRVGYNKVELDAWIPALLECDLAAITIHARTRKEMSDVPARWEHIREAIVWRDKLGVPTLILGNGDVLDLTDANRRAKETGADGAMLGRAIFGNPLLFSNSLLRKATAGQARELENKSDPRIKEKILRIMLEHVKLFEELFGDTKNFSAMKKHFKAYIAGWDGAKELRIKLMETKNAEDVEEIVSEFLSGL